MRKHLNLRANIARGLIFAFFLNSLASIPVAQAQEFVLPKAGGMVSLSPKFNPPILKGIKVHPDNPFRFDFILDRGDSFPKHMSSPNALIRDPQEEQLKQESTKLIKYFLASLTIPEKDLWVNLSPYEKARIVPQSFGLTEMGRDLLAEDYMLKQITASLIYPENEIGKKFWRRIYEEAAKRFGSTDIPVNTFNKVWIIPEKAIVYENAKSGTAYVVESKLKVMLEQDYLALEKNQRQPGESTMPNKDINALGSQIVRAIIIPELTKEVNEGKNFFQLRQVYNSLILATWYKKKIKDSILAQVYEDRKKIAGVGYKNSLPVEAIYQRYLQAFKRGAYNYIKEEQDPVTQQTITRKYFSGGILISPHIVPATDDQANSVMIGQDSTMVIDVKLDQAMQANPTPKADKNRIDSDARNLIALIIGMKRSDMEGEINSFKEDPKGDALRVFIDSFREHYSMDDVSVFAEAVNQEWKQQDLEKSYGSIFGLMASFIGLYSFIEDSQVLQQRYEWAARFLDAGSLKERAFGLWLLMVPNILHLLNIGVHAEPDKNLIIDSQILVGNNEFQGIIPRYLSALVDLKDSPDAYNEALPKLNFNGQEIKNEDFLLWGLVMASNLTIHVPYYMEEIYGTSDNGPRIRRIFNIDHLATEEEVDEIRKNVAIEKLETILSSPLLAGKKEKLKGIFKDAFSISGEDWESKYGFANPYTYFVLGGPAGLFYLYFNDTGGPSAIGENYPLGAPFLAVSRRSHRVIGGELGGILINILSKPLAFAFPTGDRNINPAFMKLEGDFRPFIKDAFDEALPGAFPADPAMTEDVLKRPSAVMNTAEASRLVENLHLPSQFTDDLLLKDEYASMMVLFNLSTDNLLPIENIRQDGFPFRVDAPMQHRLMRLSGMAKTILNPAGNASELTGPLASKVAHIISSGYGRPFYAGSEFCDEMTRVILSTIARLRDNPLALSHREIFYDVLLARILAARRLARIDKDQGRIYDTLVGGRGYRRFIQEYAEREPDTDIYRNDRVYKDLYYKIDERLFFNHPDMEFKEPVMIGESDQVYEQRVTDYRRYFYFRVAHVPSNQIPLVMAHLDHLWARMMNAAPGSDDLFRSLAEYEWWFFQANPVGRTGAALGDAMSIIMQGVKKIPLRGSFENSDFDVLSMTLGAYVKFRFNELKSPGSGRNEAMVTSVKLKEGAGPVMLSTLSREDLDRIMAHFTSLHVNRSSHGPQAGLISGGQQWTTMHSSLDSFHVDLEARVREIYAQRLDKSKPIVLLEWGGGDGNAMRQLKARLGNKIPIKIISLSYDYYSEWENDPADFVKILDDARNIDKYMPDYIGPGSVDLVISHSGLSHYLHVDWETGKFDQEASYNGYTPRDLEKHFDDLGRLLKPGGSIIIDSNLFMFPAIDIYGRSFKKAIGRKSQYFYEYAKPDPAMKALDGGARLLTPLDWTLIDKETTFDVTRDLLGNIDIRSGTVWGINETRFNYLDKQMGLMVHIEHLDKLRKDKSIPITILDWGCGKGTALVGLYNELQKRAREGRGIPNVILYGYSEEYYPSWQSAPEGITFILDTPERLREYFKGNSISFIYSHYGLSHIPNHIVKDHFNDLYHLLDHDVGEIWMMPGFTFYKEESRLLVQESFEIRNFGLLGNIMAFRPKAERDGAMKTSPTGGIDLRSDMALIVKNDGQGITFHFDPAQLKQLQNAPGLVPVIINIHPMVNLRQFLGLKEESLQQA